MFLAYKINSNNFYLRDTFNLELDFDGKLRFPLILPFLFPFMAIIGTFFMNTRGNNVLLIGMLILIPLHTIALIFLRHKVSKLSYPFSIWMVSMSLLLMHGLTSNYISGSDIHIEYYVFQLTAANSHWDISAFNHGYNTCLSITILPTLYNILTGINSLYIYKLLFQLIFSVIPLGLYVLFRKYMCDEYSFLSSMFFISQSTFIFEIVEHIRQEFAILFFAFLILVFFDDKIDNLSKKILFIVYSLSIIVSHYSTTYIFIFCMILTWVLVMFFSTKCWGIITKTCRQVDVFQIWANNEANLSIFPNIANCSRMYPSTVKMRNKPVLTISIILLIIVSTFFWFGLVTEVSFNQITLTLSRTLMSMTSFFVEDMRDSDALSAVGIGLTDDIPTKIRFWVRNITFLFIALGIFHLISTYKRSKFEIEYLGLVIASAVLVWMMIILPYLSKNYGLTRLYLQSLVVLAPCFVIGGGVFVNSVLIVFKKIRVLKFSLRTNLTFSVILFLLVLQNISATSLIFNIFGVPLMEDINQDGTLRESLYIHEGEVVGSKWLGTYCSENSFVNCDAPGFQRLYLGYELANNYKQVPPRINNFFFDSNESTSGGYIFLRQTNLLKNIVHLSSIYPTSSQIVNTSDYSHLFIQKNKIYCNGDSEVYV
jgi:uncharacterized membrane protein